MIVHGSGGTMALHEASASGKGVQIAFTDDLHNSSAQGPLPVEVPNVHCDIDLSNLGYSKRATAKAFWPSLPFVMDGVIRRTGHEIFADPSVIGDIWDQLVEAGEMPCSFTAMDKVRIKAGCVF